MQAQLSETDILIPNLESPINLSRNPGHPELAHTDMGRAGKLHIEKPQPDGSFKPSTVNIVAVRQQC